MDHFWNASLAALAAVMLTLGSVGAIVTVPPTQASSALALPALA